MSTSFKYCLTFISGLIVGGFITKKYIETKQRLEQEELEYNNDESENENNNIEYNDAESDIAGTVDSRIHSTDDEEYITKFNHMKKRERFAYDKVLENLNFEAEEIDPDLIVEDGFDESTVDRSKPYYIPEHEFESDDSYDSDEYTYYADGYLTDSYGMPVSDADMISSVGVEFKNMFDETGDDQIWIRNEQLKMDFSIIRDVDEFVDVAPPRIKRMVGLDCD